MDTRRRRTCCTMWPMVPTVPWEVHFRTLRPACQRGGVAACQRGSVSAWQRGSVAACQRVAAWQRGSVAACAFLALPTWCVVLEWDRGFLYTVARVLQVCAATAAAAAALCVRLWEYKGWRWGAGGGEANGAMETRRRCRHSSGERKEGRDTRITLRVYTIHTNQSRKNTQHNSNTHQTPRCTF